MTHLARMAAQLENATVIEADESKTFGKFWLALFCFLYKSCLFSILELVESNIDLEEFFIEELAWAEGSDGNINAVVYDAIMDTDIASTGIYSQ